MQMFYGLPPGTILQLLHFERRIKVLKPGTFIEVGPGAGDLTAILLRLGWSGSVYDLYQPTIDSLEQRFAVEIEEKRLSLNCADFLDADLCNSQVDLFLSCMVIEHFPKKLIPRFMSKVNESTDKNASIITFVPGSPAHWGVEDDIAGHVERYTFESLEREFKMNGFDCKYQVGLTYPISNWLLPVSNFLISRTEKEKHKLTRKNKTALSGHRNVRFKTYFPKVYNLILNSFVMAPLYFLQLVFKKSSSCLVIYQESIKTIQND